MSDPREGPKPLWAVALDKMRTSDGRERVFVVRLNPDEAFAFVQHYLSNSAERDSLAAEVRHLREALEVAEHRAAGWVSHDTKAYREALNRADERERHLREALVDCAEANPWTHAQSVAEKACDRLGIPLPSALAGSGRAGDTA